MPLPRDAAILVAGLSDRVYHSLTLPVDLALLGAPGCTLECSIESAHAFGGSGGLGFTHVDIPLQPELRGLEVFVQVLAVDPAANPGGLTSSNALRLRIGSR
ncbi:MAG: hypothetical protein HZB39_01915 [Planctomycetes bacterium]|nr:hypothetical protein [Planctomycetota bacterium]